MLADRQNCAPEARDGTDESTVARVVCDLDGPPATEALAARLAQLAQPGDTIALIGDLGAGKTLFARAFIRTRAAASDTIIDEVPSPTFTLVQVYPLPTGDIWHVDLYRLGAPEEALELGIEEARASGIALIEWPERLAEYLPADRLEVTLAFTDDEKRRIATVTGHGSWTARLADPAPDG